MDISTAISPLIQQAQEPKIQPEAKSDTELAASTRKFEAIFIRQFLGQALKPVLHETPESKGAGSGIYHYMMTEVISNALAEQEKFGVSTALQVELAGNQSGQSPMRE